jgi:hypothetical protein
VRRTKDVDVVDVLSDGRSTHLDESCVAVGLRDVSSGRSVAVDLDAAKRRSVASSAGRRDGVALASAHDEEGSASGARGESEGDERLAGGGELDGVEEGDGCAGAEVDGRSSSSVGQEGVDLC